MKKYLITALLAATTLAVSAQALHSSYFSESYVYRHRMNPAFENYDNYFAMPVLSNLGINANMNLGINSFILKGPQGKLVTFMHPSVSADQFLAGIEDNNYLSEQIDLTILSWGGHTWGGFTTFEVGLHEFGGFSLPRDLFGFLKEMNPNKTYQFTDARLQASSWADISLGYSREFIPGLRLGFKGKALVGIAYGDAHFTDFSASLNSEEWRIKMQGEANVACGGHFTTDIKGKLSGYKNFTPFVNGLGAALDFGMVYDFKEHFEGLRLSAAITNLGFIKWFDTSKAINDGKEFVYHGVNDATIHDEPNHTYNGDGHYTGSLSDQWDDISDDIDNLVNLTVGNSADYQEKMAPTLNLGVEYQPFRFMSLGLLYSHRFSDIFEYNETRVNLTLKLSRVLHIALSGATTTYGTVAGASLNLHAPGFNVFVGSDHLYTGAINSNYIPLEKGAADIQFGLTFPFGKRDRD